MVWDIAKDARNPFNTKSKCDTVEGEEGQIHRPHKDIARAFVKHNIIEGEEMEEEEPEEPERRLRGGFPKDDDREPTEALLEPRTRRRRRARRGLAGGC